MAARPRRGADASVRTRRPIRGTRREPSGTAAIRDWLVARVRGTYARGNWAGKGALPSFKGVPAEVAHRRHPEQHTIAEIVLHMGYWKDAVTARLTGQPWTFDDRMNWKAASPGEVGWSQAKDELAAAQRRLVAALRGVSPAQLLDRVRGRVRLIDLITDIATHDTYHAAQIFVLRRLPPPSADRFPAGSVET